MARITAFSRWLGVPIVANNDGHAQFEMRRPLEFRHVDGIGRVKLGQKETLHHIADRVYGNMRYWWALAEFNDIFDPTTELEAGDIIFVPPPEEITRSQSQTA
jgi:nucleoid-associated protein YgaU